MLARAFVFLLVVGAAVYANHFQNAFQFDDFHSIVENPSIRRLDAWRSWFTDLGAFSVLPENLNYRPLLLLSFALSYRLSGPEVWGFHLLSWLVHVGAACLVFLIARRLFAGTQAGRSTAPPPVRGRARPLRRDALPRPSGECRVGELHLVALGEPRGVLRAPRLRRLSRHGGGAGRPARAIRGASFAAGSGLAFIAGLLTKEIAITLPALVVWYAIALGDRARSPSSPRASGGGGSISPGSRSSPSCISPGGRRSSRPKWCGRARRWGAGPISSPRSAPGRITCGSSSGPPASMSTTPTSAGARPLRSPRAPRARRARRARARCSSRFRRRVPLAAFGVGWFWIALWPAASLFALAEPVNGHRAYLAHAGLAIAVAAAGGAALAALTVSPAMKRRILAAALCLLGLVLGAATWKRNQVWHSPRSLWADTVAKSPGNGRAWMNLGLAHLAAGDTAAAGRAFDVAVDAHPELRPRLRQSSHLAAAHRGSGGRRRRYRSQPPLGPGQHLRPLLGRKTLRRAGKSCASRRASGSGPVLEPEPCGVPALGDRGRGPVGPQGTVAGAPGRARGAGRGE